jgi:histidinol-phosphate phosphatase family protein
MDSMPSKAPAVFFDWDSVVLDRFPGAPAGSVPLRGAAPGALAMVAAAGYRVVLLATAPEVAHGRVHEQSLCETAREARRTLERIGVPLEAFYYCSHDPAGIVPGHTMTCRCRRPQPGLILRAARERGLDLEWSWMVGDLLDDVEAGLRAGCRTILLGSGRETEWRLGPNRLPHHIAGHVGAAAGLIGWMARRDRSEPTTAGAVAGA